MMSSRILMMSLFCVLTMVCMAYAAGGNSTGFVPKDGFVPDEATAAKIAEAVLVPIYGHDAIDAERPFKASLNGDTWVITGTLRPGRVGGVAVVKLSRKDARVISVIHGK